MEEKWENGNRMNENRTHFFLTFVTILTYSHIQHFTAHLFSWKFQFENGTQTQNEESAKAKSFVYYCEIFIENCDNVGCWVSSAKCMYCVWYVEWKSHFNSIISEEGLWNVRGDNLIKHWIDIWIWNIEQKIFIHRRSFAASFAFIDIYHDGKKNLTFRTHFLFHLFIFEAENDNHAS